MKRIIITICLAVVASGCDKTTSRLYTSFLDTYVSLNSLEVYNKSGIIGLRLNGDSYAFDGTGQEKHVFDSVSTKNNDISFNKERSVFEISYRAMCFCKAYSPEIAGIDVVCDVDYDAEHPVGSSLADCFALTFKNASKFIAGNYSGDEPEYIKKSLAEMSLKDWHLMFNLETHLSFTKFPQAEGEYMFQVTLTLEDGSVLSDKIWMFAEKGENGIYWNKTKYIKDKSSTTTN